MINKWVFMYLTIVNVMPKWLAKLNVMLTLFNTFCIILVKAQDKKERMIRHNKFVKKYRIVSVPIKIGDLDAEMVTIELREDQEVES